jgi:5-methylcytosine-specific restriction endonuclease McrA
MRHSPQYLERINSPEWRELKERLILKRGNCCQQCGKERKTLHLHHVTYERLGNERDSDLILLCAGCHALADTLRTVIRQELQAEKEIEEQEARKEEQEISSLPLYLRDFGPPRFWKKLDNGDYIEA